jgi:serine protease inhibitor
MSSPYLRALDEFYKVKAETVDFDGENCSGAVDVVNGWLRRQTGGRVFRILNGPTSCDSKLLTVSAVTVTASLVAISSNFLTASLTRQRNKLECFITLCKSVW